MGMSMGQKEEVRGCDGDCTIPQDDVSVKSRVLREEKGVELTLKPGSFDKFPYFSLSCQGCAFVPNSHCFLSLPFVHSTFVGLVGDC